MRFPFCQKQFILNEIYVLGFIFKCVHAFQCNDFLRWHKNHIQCQIIYKLLVFWDLGRLQVKTILTGRVLGTVS